MLQTLSSAFLAQFQNDEGQALTVVSESIPINDKIEVPFVLDNSVGRQVLTRDDSSLINHEPTLSSIYSTSRLLMMIGSSIQHEKGYKYFHKLGIKRYCSICFFIFAR